MVTPSPAMLRGLVVGLIAGAVLGATTVSPGALGRNDAGVLARLAALEALAEHMVVVQGSLHGMPGPHLIFEGVNVHIRSGSGASDDGTTESGGVPLGLGNLVVGYNAPPVGLAAGERSGSHTLIIGDAHRYTSWGGLVAGAGNTLAAPETSITGGSFNVASGLAATVSGGSGNLASGVVASVTGGLNNLASGEAASVTGGSSNQATGDRATVSGGATNTASATQTSVSGGASNTASATQASVGGGSGNNANGGVCWRVSASLTTGC